LENTLRAFPINQAKQSRTVVELKNEPRSPQQTE
jgi:hypothetical protein